MSILGLTKAVTDLVVSAGAGAVVGNAIKATTPPDAKVLTKVSIGIGGFVLSGAVGQWAAKYTSDQIDGTVEQIKDVSAAVRNIKAARRAARS